MTTEVNTDSHCNEKDNTYNGWKNRETWALALWFGNDQGRYVEMTQFIQECKDTGMSKETAVFALEDFFKDHVKECLNEIKDGMIRDMFCIDDIDFHQVAVAELEDYEEAE